MFLKCRRNYFFVLSLNMLDLIKVIFEGVCKLMWCCLVNIDV